MQVEVGRGAIELVADDITGLRVHAVVNAANRTLTGGGGVDGAIHRAAGPDLLAACLELPQLAPGVRCPTGDVRVTAGGDLAARYVIHGVGPIHSQYEPAEAARLLRGVHVRALEEAESRGCASVAFPAISCGVYGFPVDEAAPVAVAAAREALERDGSVTKIVFALVDARAMHAWRRALGA